MKKVAVSLVAAVMLLGLLAGCSVQPETITTTDIVTLDVGETATLAWEVLPAEADDRTVQFSSSDALVASVDDSGVVSGVAPGAAIIKVTTANGLGSEVNVTVIQPVEKVVSETALVLAVGESGSVNAKALPDNASDPSLQYDSADDEIASVDESGLVTAHAAGETIITTTSGSGASSSTTITVEIPVVEIQFEHSELYIYLNGSLQLAASVLPEDATHQELRWSSSDESVATVDDDGTITAVALGGATITATAGNGVSAECEVVVIKQESSSGSGSSGGSGDGNNPGSGGSAPSGGTQGGDGSSGGGGTGGGGAPAGITDAQINQAVSDAQGYAASLGFSIVGTPQPGHSIASTAYYDYDAFYRNLIDNVDYVAGLFAGEDLSLVMLCIYRSGNSVYVTYG